MKPYVLLTNCPLLLTKSTEVYQIIQPFYSEVILNRSIDQSGSNPEPIMRSRETLDFENH